MSLVLTTETNPGTAVWTDAAAVNPPVVSFNPTETATDYTNAQAASTRVRILSINVRQGDPAAANLCAEGQVENPTTPDAWETRSYSGGQVVGEGINYCLNLFVPAGWRWRVFDGTGDQLTFHGYQIITF